MTFGKYEVEFKEKDGFTLITVFNNGEPDIEDAVDDVCIVTSNGNTDMWQFIKTVLVTLREETNIIDKANIAFETERIMELKRGQIL